MIFEPLRDADTYMTIAKRGCNDMDEDFMIDDAAKVRARIKALSWFKDCMEKALRNSSFAIRNKPDKEIVKKFLEDIKELDKHMKLITKKIPHGNKTIIGINEEAFDNVFSVLVRIKTDVNEPLNKSDLIFMYKESFDPKQFKQGIKDSFVEGG